MAGWARQEKSGERGGDHNLASHFDFELEGTKQNGVIAVSGLENSLQTVNFVNGNDLTTRSRVTRNNPITIKVTRYYTAGMDDWVQYHQTHMKGDTKRGTASVILKNIAGDETARFNLNEVQPVRWRLGELLADKAANLTEEMDLVCESVTYVPGKTS